MLPNCLIWSDFMLNEWRYFSYLVFICSFCCVAKYLREVRHLPEARVHAGPDHHRAGHGERSRLQLLLKFAGTRYMDGRCATENMSVLDVNVLVLKFWLLVMILLQCGVFPMYTYSVIKNTSGVSHFAAAFFFSTFSLLCFFWFIEMYEIFIILMNSSIKNEANFRIAFAFFFFFFLLLVFFWVQQNHLRVFVYHMYCF